MLVPWGASASGEGIIRLAVLGRRGSLMSMTTSPNPYSDPLAPAEHGERDQGGQDDQAPAPGIAVGPVQFRHGFEVHAVDAGDQHRRDADDGGDRHDLHDVVL